MKLHLSLHLTNTFLFYILQNLLLIFYILLLLFIQKVNLGSLKFSIWIPWHIWIVLIIFKFHLTIIIIPIIDLFHFHLYVDSTPGAVTCFFIRIITTFLDHTIPNYMNLWPLKKMRMNFGKCWRWGGCGYRATNELSLGYHMLIPPIQLTRWQNCANNLPAMLRCHRRLFTIKPWRILW